MVMGMLCEVVDIMGYGFNYYIVWFFVVGWCGFCYTNSSVPHNKNNSY